MTATLDEMLHALQQPACYPHHPDHVEMIQTHISAVFLAGEEVYKLKKPVRFSFVDYSTLALRQQVPVLFLECRTSLAEVDRRLRERERRGDSVSDATWELALREQDTFPPFDDLPEQCHVIIDTEHDIDEALEAVAERIAAGKK